jgi:MFS family permease
VVNKARFALYFVHIAMGLAIMAPATRFAEIKEALGVEDAVFGYALALGSLGGIIGNALATKFIARLGTRRSLQIFGLGMILVATLMAFSFTIYFFALLSLLASASYGVLNAAYNTQGVEIEGYLKRSVLPGLHGAWNIGALVTAFFANFVASFLSPQIHLLIVGIVAAVVLMYASVELLREDHVDDERGHFGKIPQSNYSLILFLSFGLALGMIAETSALDWSAIYLRENLGIALGLNSVGVTVLLVCKLVLLTLIGRWNDKHGHDVIVRRLGIIGAVGYMSLILLTSFLANDENWYGTTKLFLLTLMSFVVLAIGVAAIPAAYWLSAGKIPGMSTTRGIAIVGVAMAAVLLILRPLFAFIAGSIGIEFALALTGLTLMGSALMSKHLRPVSAL